jgi:hypothetical protein
MTNEFEEKINNGEIKFTIADTFVKPLSAIEILAMDIRKLAEITQSILTYINPNKEDTSAALLEDFKSLNAIKERYKDIR